MRVCYKTLWLAAVVIASLPLHARARELYVDPSGGGDYTTITAAVAAAVAGDTVVVACGTYREPWILILKNISVRSETRDPECVILDGQGTHRIMSVGRGDATQYIEGFTFANGYVNSEWSDAGALGIDGYGATIRNCVFRDNVSVRTSAGALGFTGYLRIEGCQFYDNTAATWGGAIYGPGGGPLMVTDCTFAGNYSRLGGAVCVEGMTTVIERSVFTGNRSFLQYDTCGALYVYGGGCVVRNCSLVANESSSGSASVEVFNNVQPPARLTVENTIIAFDTGGASIRCLGQASATVSCSDLFGNSGGDWTGCVSGQLGVDGNICGDPLFCEPPVPESPLTIHANSPCAPEYSPCGELIGARDVGCGVSPVLPLSWSRVKALYR